MRQYMGLCLWVHSVAGTQAHSRRGHTQVQGKTQHHRRGEGWGCTKECSERLLVVMREPHAVPGMGLELGSFQALSSVWNEIGSPWGPRSRAGLRKQL